MSEHCRFKEQEINEFAGNTSEEEEVFIEEAHDKVTSVNASDEAVHESNDNPATLSINARL